MIDDEVPFDELPTPKPIDDSDEIRMRREMEPADEFDVDPSGVTDPISWLERDLDGMARDIVDRSARDPGTATPWGQSAKDIARSDGREAKWRRRWRMAVRAVRELRVAIKELRAAISPERIATIESLGKTARWIRRGAVTVALALAGSFVTLYGSYRDHEQGIGAESARSVERDHKIERLEKDLEKQSERFDRVIDQIRIELGRRSQLDLLPNVSRADDPFALQLASKGSLP